VVFYDFTNFTIHILHNIFYLDSNIKIQLLLYDLFFFLVWMEYIFKRIYFINTKNMQIFSITFFF